MTLEAFQAAIARLAEPILMIVLGIACSMILLAIAGISSILSKRFGHQPSSAAGAPTTGIPSGGSSGSRERPEPPRSGSGAQAPVDPLARIARLRAELEDLVFVAQGGGRTPDTPTFLNWTADRLQHHHGEKGSQDYVLGLRDRSKQLEQALINARRTLEATKP